jgi:hypothetical protein
MNGNFISRLNINLMDLSGNTEAPKRVYFSMDLYWISANM